jgi:hypothetical protein
MDQIKLEDTQAYYTPMRKLIRYMPHVTIWMIDRNLTRTVGGHGNHVFKKLYDYEFYEDIFLVKKWYTRGKDNSSISLFFIAEFDMIIPIVIPSAL